MVSTQALVEYINGLLKPELFKDYGPNGLQVQGQPNINKIVTGVSCNQALIDKAIEQKANAILVHHGIFWKSTPSPITGVQYQRIKPLIEHGINLLAYHLPLDAHPTLGNNARLGHLLDLTIDRFVDFDRIPGLCAIGHLQKPMSGAAFAEKLEKTLNHKPLHIACDKPISTIAWCTGAAQNYLSEAMGLSVDAYLTGEYSLATIELANELDMHFYAAGHHATERGGVIALGDDIAQKFNIDVDFVDIVNPA